MKHCVCLSVDNYSAGTPCTRQSADKDCRMIQSVGTGKHGGSVVVCFLRMAPGFAGHCFGNFADRIESDEVSALFVCARVV